MSYVKTINETYNIRGDKFTIKTPQCYSDNGRKIFNMKIDTIAVNKAFNTYRKKHHMLLPKDIQKLDNKFKHSGKNLAKIIGIKPSILRSYEQGSLTPNLVEKKLEILSQ